MGDGFLSKRYLNHPYGTFYWMVKIHAAWSQRRRHGMEWQLFFLIPKPKSFVFVRFFSSQVETQLVLLQIQPFQNWTFRYVTQACPSFFGTHATCKAFWGLRHLDDYAASFLDVPLEACGVPLAGAEAIILSGPEKWMFLASTKTIHQWAKMELGTFLMLDFNTSIGDYPNAAMLRKIWWCWLLDDSLLEACSARLWRCCCGRSGVTAGKDDPEFQSAWLAWLFFVVVTSTYSWSFEVSLWMTADDLWSLTLVTFGSHRGCRDVHFMLWCSVVMTLGSCWT